MKQNVSPKRKPGRPKGSKNKPKVPPVLLDKGARRVQRIMDKLDRDETKERATTGPPEETKWKPGQSGNPTGLPPGYVAYATAYRIAVTLPQDELDELAAGNWPTGWHRERCQTYVIAAAAVLKMRRDSPPALLSEIADRSDGKVPQTIRQTVELQGIIALPAPRGLDTWATVIDAHLVEAPALPPGSDA